MAPRIPRPRTAWVLARLMSSPLTSVRISRRSRPCSTRPPPSLLALLSLHPSCLRCQSRRGRRARSAGGVWRCAPLPLRGWYPRCWAGRTSWCRRPLCPRWPLLLPRRRGSRDLGAALDRPLPRSLLPGRVPGSGRRRVFLGRPLTRWRRLRDVQLSATLTQVRLPPKPPVLISLISAMHPSPLWPGSPLDTLPR